LKAVASRKRVLGFDVMEFCPEQGTSSCAFLLAKLVYKFLGYALP
jgi:arginase family enzyme